MALGGKSVPFPLDEHTRETIRHHFRRKNLVWTEDYFINVLEHSDGKHDVYWAVIALRDCGTTRCLPYLKSKLTYPMQDVKCTSILTIAHIAGSAETELYAQALLDPRYREKGYAIWAIQHSADERAVEAVIAYFRKNLSRIRRSAFHNATLADGLDYLAKYIDRDPRVLDLFTRIQDCWEKISEGERKSISNRIRFFGRDNSAA